MKNKKTRDVSSSESYKIIQKHGLETVRETGKRHGMYEAGRILDVSPYVLRYLSRKYEGLRNAENCQNIIIGVQRGLLDPSRYKSLDGSNVDLTNNKERNK